MLHERTVDRCSSRTTAPPPPDAPLTSRDQARRHTVAVGFRTGPARQLGVELEYTVHHVGAPARPVRAEELREALGPHAPIVLDPDQPPRPLPGGSWVTIEPGGQVELSTAPQPGLSALAVAAEADRRRLAGLLGDHGLVCGRAGLDPARPPRPVLRTPRYEAMARAYDRDGAAGHIMMRCSAGLQVCLDAGEPGELTARWTALHLFGPPLLAAFATSSRLAGRDTGQASARMVAWLDITAGRTDPVWSPGVVQSPGDAWAAYALDAPLLCVRRDGPDWSAPPGITFGDWLDGALPEPPTTRDLDHHLSTLFPPVRPRGYLEVRYLDAQPGPDWIAPTAALAALLADPTTTERAADLCAPAADRWRAAATAGMADPVVGPVARELLVLAGRELAGVGLPDAEAARVRAIFERRTTGEGRP
ncbi:glutamate-cysteine ligase family protein [Pilimelia columellifera]|uniref:Glutamate--cysteine ligase EgtA n=1 Tax=Pilimelia columellifera subsp. columellifera TaxID=706583 RepID=A0ABN3NL96_9ACTN